MMAQVWSIMCSILYELQPFRVQDVVSLFKYIIRSSTALGGAGLAASDTVYQYSFDAIALLSWKKWMALVIWVVIWIAFIYAEFGSLWIIISMISSIFLNLGKRKEGELSAYSVFNEGFKQLLGTLTAEQFDDAIRSNNHNPHNRNRMRDIVQLDDVAGEEIDDWLDQPGHRNRGRNRTVGAGIGDEDEKVARPAGGNRKAKKGGGSTRKKTKKNKKQSKNRERDHDQGKECEHEEEDYENDEVEKAGGVELEENEGQGLT